MVQPADAACDGAGVRDRPWAIVDIVNLLEDGKDILRKERMERAKERREQSYDHFGNP